LPTQGMTGDVLIVTLGFVGFSQNLLIIGEHVPA
jgi:hypothetical protein